MNIILRFITDKYYRFSVLYNRALINQKRADDELVLKALYKVRIGRELNLDNPKAYTEKLQWIKLYDHNPIYTKLVDKYEVKQYVSGLIGEDHIIPTLGVYDSFDEIDFSQLPMRFVIKTNHDSGGIVIVPDKTKMDVKAAKRIICKSLKRNFFYHSREWAYKNVKPKILIEEYLPEVATCEVPEYKIFCFNGKAKMIDVCSGKAHTNNRTNDYCDLDLKRFPFTSLLHNSEGVLEKPKNFDLMISFAEKLSEGFPQVRMDFYNINGKIYFGEFTFTSNSGLAKFEPDEWDFKIGEWMALPKEKRI